MAERAAVARAAELLKLNPQTVKCMLRGGVEWGFAVPPPKGRKHYMYHISFPKLYEYLNISEDEII